MDAIALPGIGDVSIPNFIIAIIAIVFGIIMCVKPRIVAYLVGAYLILWGIFFFVGC
jgi:hypothetical protein